MYFPVFGELVEVLHDVLIFSYKSAFRHAIFVFLRLENEATVLVSCDVVVSVIVVIEIGIVRVEGDVLVRCLLSGETSATSFLFRYLCPRRDG